MIQEIRNWTLHYENVEPLTGSVPCSMYSLLLAGGKMEDPFYRMNEYEARDLSEKDCEMTASFSASEEERAEERQLLRFYGVDTLADIYLNGRLLGHAENMHRTWEYDVKGLLQAENTVKIHFYSPLKAAREAAIRYPVWGSAPVEGHQHVRKSHCMYGWDWGPCLPDMGLYRPVKLMTYSDAEVRDVWVRQRHEEGKVILHITAEADFPRGELPLSVTVYDPDGAAVARADSLEDLTIEKPRLWWPNGWGEHPLYTVTVQAKKEGTVCAEKSVKIGLRTMTVSLNPDQWGKEFCFVVNGKKLFAMGADYIPEDNILARVTPERTRELMEDCVRANYNCVRVWGGGYYPDDFFFDACDEKGLIVWLDFMFACADYRLSKKFKENIIPEFIENLKRLRNRASLGLLCGNNENETAWLNWGMPQNQRTKLDYLELFEGILPDICEEYAPDTFYWPSSPSSGGGFQDPADENRGDTHCWSVWHGGKPFTFYRSTYFRFCSEFGFESFPNIKTCREFSLPEDRNPFTKVMESHQKCIAGNQKILNYMSADYLFPKDFDSFVYASQLLQADAMRFAIEHWRANRGRCMGALYWQLNDCWPVASWASIDSAGRWKALHYDAKRSFAPLMLAAFEEGTQASFAVCNESLRDRELTVSWRILDRDFKEYGKGTIPVHSAALSAVKIPETDFAPYLEGDLDHRYLAFALLDEEGTVISKKAVLFEKPKHFQWKKPEIAVTFGEKDGKTAITLRAGTFVKGLCLSFRDTDLVLSDNYFDLVDGETVTVTVDKVMSGPADAETLRSSLELCSVYDIAE